MSVVIIHLALAIILFFVVNWIGEHSSSFGYLQLPGLNTTNENTAIAGERVLWTWAPRPIWDDTPAVHPSFASVLNCWW